MRRNFVVRISALAVAAAGLLAPSVFSASPGQSVEGVITHVELHDSPRHIMVRAGGEEVRVPISNRTTVEFQANDQGFFSPELSSLKSGMEVRATYTGDTPVARVLVTSVPPDQRREAINAFERTRGTSTANADEMKVRLLKIDRDRGEVSADVAGRPRNFQVEDPKMLSRFDEGDLVVVTVKNGSGDRFISDIRSAMIYGRVTSVDRNSSRVNVLVDGREESFRVEKANAIRLNQGDRIAFEVEERAGGERVIKKIEERN